MISKLLKILNTNIIIPERPKQNIINFLIRILKSNIFIFFILGTFFSIIDWNYTNKDNFFLSNNTYYVYLTIKMILIVYIPFFVAVLLNLVIKFTKNERIKKVFKIIMIITNILSVIYLLLSAYLYYCVATMFD